MRGLFDLTGKVAIVTGGNGGIGRAIALGLAQHGADIVVAARNEHKTAAVVSEVETMGRRCIGVRCDVLQHDDITATVDTAARELGGVNILVNNAGVGHGGQPTHTVQLETWQRVIDINLTAVFLPGRLPGAGEGRRRQDHQRRFRILLAERRRQRALLRQQGGCVEPDADHGARLGRRQHPGAPTSGPPAARVWAIRRGLALDPCHRVNDIAHRLG